MVRGTNSMSIYLGTTKLNKVGSTTLINRIYVGGATTFGGAGELQLQVHQALLTLLLTSRGLHLDPPQIQT